MEPKPHVDAPERLLRVAVRLLPRDRSEWGAAMAAELAQLQSPSERWSFALGCARVALSPVHPAAAAFLGIVLTVPFASFLSIAYFGIEPLEGYLRAWVAATDEPRQRVSGLMAILASFLLLPVGSFVALTPAVRGFRIGNRLQTYPLNLSVGIAIMGCFLLLLGGFVIDQLPCWQGVPNCD